MPFTQDPPVLTAIVFCDSVLTAVTPDRKVSLIGTHETWNLPIFPFAANFMTYVSLAGVREPVTMQLRVAIPTDNLEIERVDFGASMAMQHDPATGYATAVVGAIIPITRPGRYEMLVYVNESLMGLRPFQVNRVPMPGGPQPPGAGV